MVPSGAGNINCVPRSVPDDGVRLDACPGALRPHQAADGLLVRVRLPGGVLADEQLRVLADVSAEHGNGHLELTSRANVQIRALGERSIEPVAARLTAAGLLPSATHERVRNIIASPLAGRVPPGRWDVRPAVRELDRRLIAEPQLAELSGRFLFGLDDGGADIAAMRPDLGVLPVADECLALLVAGHDVGLRLCRDDVVPALLAGARAFLAERAAQDSQAWRLDGLSAGPERVKSRLLKSADCDLWENTEPLMVRRPGKRPVGVLKQTDGLVSVGLHVPLGALSAKQAGSLAQIGNGIITITPWRSVVLGDLESAAADDCVRAFVGAGLIIDPESAWLGVSACAGRPGCAKAQADVRADATAVVAGAKAGTRDSRSLPVYWAGCERRCGKPAEAAIEVLAAGGSYEVSGAGATLPARTPAEVAAVIAEIRRR
jgi:precorrin-3B synthase